MGRCFGCLGVCFWLICLSSVGWEFMIVWCLFDRIGL